MYCRIEFFKLIHDDYMYETCAYIRTHTYTYVELVICKSHVLAKICESKIEQHEIYVMNDECLSANPI